MKTFIKKIIGPFVVCRYHKIDTFVWFMFTLVASQLGVIINLIYRWVFMGWDFQAALCPESATGTFYTFALVMVSSLLSPLFIRIIRKEEPSFNKIRIVFVTLLFFFLIMAAVFSAFTAQTAELSEYASLTNDEVAVDIKQMLFFVITILVSIYAFGLNYLHLHPEEYGELADDYKKREDEKVDEMTTDLTMSSNVGGIAI